MSEYAMFYARDDKSDHWVELSCNCRSSVMFQTVKSRLEYYSWVELTANDLRDIIAEVTDFITSVEKRIAQYHDDIEFLKTLGGSVPLDEIINRRDEYMADIADSAEVLVEYEAVRNELEVYRQILDNSAYSSNKTHICLAHECNPNGPNTDDED